MLGRAAYHDPWLLRVCEQDVSGSGVAPDRMSVLRSMSRYCEEQIKRGVPVRHISRHLLGLFQGLPGARKWRRYLSGHTHLEPGNSRLFRQAWDYAQRDLSDNRDAA
ncbi:MAG: tRNA-dihydrouridine synthase, partial [Lysobacterales bacterium]